MMKKFLKILHSLGAIGLMGGYATYLLLALKSSHGTPAELATSRVSIEMICSWLILPSMGLVLMSGLLSIAAHHPFANALWVWIKTVSGLSVFEGTLGIQSHARTVADLAAKAALGEGDSAELARQLRTERWGLWFLLFVALANVVLGIWRPRLRSDAKKSAA